MGFFRGFVLVACVVPLAASAFDVPLTYATFDENSNVFQPYGYHEYDGSATLPAGDWKLPALVSKKPIYQLIRLGERDHLLVLDQQKADDPFYNRLYLDVNANRDLTDDKPLDATTVEDDWPFVSADFPVFDLTVVAGGKEFPYRLDIAAERFSPGIILRTLAALAGSSNEETSIEIQTHCMYTGQFEFGGKTYKIWLSDENANGRFNEELTVGAEAPDSTRGPSLDGDAIYLSPDRDTDADPEMQYVSDYCVLGNQILAMTVDLGEKKIVFSPYDAQAGQVRLPGPFEHMIVVSVDHTQSISLFKPETIVPLPAGMYRLVEYSLDRKDEQGAVWHLEASGRQDTQSFSVVAGQETPWTLCDPLNPHVVVMDKQPRTRWFGPPEVSLEFAVAGAGGERITGITCYEKGDKNGDTRDLPEPTFKAIKADGEVVAQGTFEYG